MRAQMSVLCVCTGQLSFELCFVHTCATFFLSLKPKVTQGILSVFLVALVAALPLP